MSLTMHKPEMLKILSSLSEIPLQYTDRREALKMIAEYCKEALDSQLCTIAFVDLEHRFLRQVACNSFNKEFEQFMESQHFIMGASDEGSHIDFKLLAEGKVLRLHGLKENGRGVAKPEIARRFDFDSLLSYPLKSRHELIGYINHFSSASVPFTEEEEELLAIFASHAVNIIDRSDYFSVRDQTLSIFNDLLPNLVSGSPHDFLREVPAKVCELLSVPVCVVWKVDKAREKLKVVAASSNVDETFRQITISLEERGIQRHLKRGKPGYLTDVTVPSSFYAHPDEAKERGWVSLLSAPMWVGRELIGMLDIYTYKVRVFEDWHVALFKAFAAHVALSIQKANILAEKEEASANRLKLQKLSEVMLAMTETDNENALLETLMNGSLDLVGANTKGWISLLDLKSGHLDIVFCPHRPDVIRNLKIGEGVTGEALFKERPIRVPDVSEKENYVSFWHDTRSELAIPMIVAKASVTVGSEPKTVSKRIGVLNIESPEPGRFSKSDEDCLWSLARQAALRIDRFEFDRKLYKVRRIAREVVDKPGYDLIIKRILSAIRETLGFEYVNISLVNRGLGHIKSEYVDGISPTEQEEFKKRATYPLDGNTIHAEVLEKRKPLVPQITDERLDAKLYNRFRLGGMIRLFMPMRSSSDRQEPIGTVEVGYRHLNREYIYERDVQVLEVFVDYAAWALEQEKSGKLDKISHEFKSPINGIRYNADYLIKNGDKEEWGWTRTKLKDILTDCEILLHQVEDLDYLLGRPFSDSDKVPTLVYRNIIIKTINQLKPDVAGRGYNPSKVLYNRADSSRIKVVVDRAKLNRVVYNLLTNSIKYAESDPEAFRIKIELEEEEDFFIIKFKDWGIGVREEFKEKIFEDGFRTEEAKAVNVSGSGLGLTIARGIMREIGGDLKLHHNYKPTEFHMLLPKKPR